MDREFQRQQMFLTYFLRSGQKSGDMEQSALKSFNVMYCSK